MPACTCAWVTEMPFEAATWSSIGEPDQPGQHRGGHLGGGQLHLRCRTAPPPYCKLDTWVSSEDDGDPLVADDRRGAHLHRGARGEHRARAKAGTERGHAAALLANGSLAETQAIPSIGVTQRQPQIYDSDSTERTTSAHHASSSASRSGSPPKPPPEAPDFGTGTSIVRTAGLSSVFGYSR